MKKHIFLIFILLLSTIAYSQDLAETAQELSANPSWFSIILSILTALILISGIIVQSRWKNHE